MMKKNNALQHGLLRKKIQLMPDESRYLFNQHNKQFMDYWQPQSLTEAILVEQLAFNYWRLRRAFRLETEFFRKAKSEVSDMNARVRERGWGAEGYSVDHLNFENFDKFTRYITSIQRQITRNLHELERLQTIRKGGNPAIPSAIDIEIQEN